MASILPNVSTWVKNEPFTYGIYQVHPHPRLSVHNIKKLVTYAKSKGKSGFPKLSYPIWKHIACFKLQLPEDLAWNLFQACIIMCAPSSARLREMETKMAACKDDKELSAVRNVQSVPLLKFVIFLYIQQINKISLKASIASTSAEWPDLAKTSTSGDFESGRTTPTKVSKNLDEHQHLQFVLENLMEILDLLVEPDSYGLGGSDACVSNEAVDDLSFIIACSADGNKSVKSLGELASNPGLMTRMGYSKMARSFSVRGLASWLRSTLGNNPFGIDNCVTTGKRLSWPLSGVDPASDPAVRRQKIATNAAYAPRGHKLVIMSQVAQQTVARSSGTLQDSCLKVHRCHNSNLYLLSPLRCVSLEKCRKTVVVLGPVESTLHVNQCEDCVVYAMARRVLVSASKHCTLYLLTPSNPVLLSTNEHLLLAPYCTFYPTLGDHMQRVNLNPAGPNLWDQPLLLACSGMEATGPEGVWSLLPPQEFCPLAVPFEMSGETKEVPCAVPARYLSVLEHRRRLSAAWQDSVRSQGLSREQKRNLQEVVEQRFKAWLQETGHQRQLDQLDTQPKPSNGSPARVGRED